MIDDYKKCDTCKHFYDLDFYADFHTVCSLGHCYLCAGKWGCSDYEKGEVPQNKERGNFK